MLKKFNNLVKSQKSIMAANIQEFTENRPKILEKRTLLVITGASKGLGRQLALDFIPRISSGSFILLISSNETKLEETFELVEQAVKDCHGKGVIKVRTVPFDLREINAGTSNQLLEAIPSCLDEKFEQIIFIHNAGTLGDVGKKARELLDAPELHQYWNLNISSPVIFNSAFLRRFEPNTKRGILIINISSLCAVQAMKTWSLYCTGIYEEIFSLRNTQCSSG